MLVLDMIEIISPLGKYKYDTWRMLPVKWYIGNSMWLRSYIQNVNKHFWRRCQGGSQYFLSVYRLHRIILTSIISLTDLSVALCLFMVFIGRCMTGFDLLANYHSDLESLIRKSHSKAFFTSIFWIPHPRDYRQISGITTATRTRIDGCPEVHQWFLSSIQCQR
jgi:hypothetical protein